VPGVEAFLPRFQAANTQVLGISVDSVHCHANWARDLGGVSFPLLADFQPKGAVAESFGAYLAAPGITDRATVLIDSGGTVRHASSVGPAGERKIAELVSLCEDVDQAGSSTTATTTSASAKGLGSDAVLYVRKPCGMSRRVQVAADNLHATGLAVCNVSDDSDALAALKALSGGETAPCLKLDGASVLEADDIVRALADRLAPIG
jgi:glutaredoxin-related protein